MPRLKGSVPRYCKHKASGQAVVTLSGQDFYLGPHGTKVSHDEYDRAVAEWLARGRRPLLHNEDQVGTITVVELIAAYKRFAERYYRKNGKPTNEVTAIMSVASVLRQLYGRLPVNEFGPLKLQALQQALIGKGWCRKNINKQIGRIVRMFAWGVSQELITDKQVAQALREVKGLHKGRTEARETAPVMPVEESIINATLEHLPSVVANMVRFQRLTGCRPEEVCLIRPVDVDTSGRVWAYRPESHKMEHKGRERVIFIGPKAQDVLRPYLLRDKSAYCFSPADSERKRREAQHEARKTPLSCGNVPGSNRSQKPKRPAGTRYTTDSYRRAIHRGCELAFEMPDELRNVPAKESDEDRKNRLARARQWRDKHTWHPNRLRHSAATEIRKQFGLEAAQVTLGHAMADVTQVYAERDHARAIDVMAKIG